MLNLNKAGFETTMLSDNLSESILEIQNILINKYNMEELKIQRINNLNMGFLKAKKEVLNAFMSWAEDCDLIVTSDFLMAWLLDHNNIKLNKPLLFMASNNMNFHLKYLIDSGIPSLINIHKISFSSKLVFRSFLLKNILNRFDYIFTTSNYVKSEMSKLNLNVKITAVPIGVNLNNTYKPLKNDDNKFLYFGWGSGIRGLQDVIKAFELYSKTNTAELDVCLQGQHGMEESYYTHLLNKSKLRDRIKLNFFDKNLENIILSSKAVILPFRIPFGYSQPPLAVLETMALGRVVISTKIGCIPEIISNRSDGFLVNPGNPREISKTLASLTFPEANSIGCKAYEKISSSFSWKVVLPQYIKMFDEIGEVDYGNGSGHKI